MAVHLNPKDKNKSFFSEWLEKLQQESWQLELLISGLALYGIFEARTLLIDFDAYIYLNTEGVPLKFLILLYLTLKVGWIIFLINLLIHIVLRGLWIGAIGLRYVSGDINYGELGYSERFSKYLKKRIGSYDSFIEKLEKICSVLFAYTFLLFLFFFSAILFLGFFIILVVFFDSFLPQPQYKIFFGFLFIFYLILGLIVFIDLITLGIFKRIKEDLISKIYFVIYRFISLITFSFLYRPLLYNFLDQKYTKRLFFFSFPYIFVIFLITLGNQSFSNKLLPYIENNQKLQESGFMVNDRFYEDLRNKSLQYKDEIERKKINYDMPFIVLNKYYMDDSYPSIFFKMINSDKELLKKNKTISPIFEEGIKFMLFKNGEFPRVKNNIKSPNSKTLDSLNKEKLSCKKSLRSAKRLKNNKEVDSLSIKLNSIRKLITLSKETLKQNNKTTAEANYLGIMNAFKNYIDIKIDNVNYTDSLKCNYYTHPSTGYQGFLCHFNSDSITNGYHELSFKRVYYSKNRTDSTQTFSIKLPFIKITK